MSRLTKYAGIGVLVVIITALTISSAAFAQGTPSATPTAPQVHSFGRGMMCGQAGLDAAAAALKMTSAELSAQLWGGRTLADLADKAGVDLQTVQSAVQTACQQAIKDAIQQAVKDGVTPENLKVLAPQIKAEKDKATTLKGRVEAVTAKLHQVSVIYTKP